MTKKNIEVLNSIKESAIRLCEKNRFDFSEKNEEANLRKPNMSELKAWLIDRLRMVHFETDLMPTATYYSLKGEVNHCSFTPVLNYLHKRGFSCHQEFERYKESKSIYTVPVEVAFPAPTKRIIIDIDIKRQEKENEKKGEEK